MSSEGRDQGEAVDWEMLLQDDAVRALVEAMTQMWPVWMGALDRHEHAHPLQPAVGARPGTLRPFFDVQLARAGRHVTRASTFARDSPLSCAQDMSLWARVGFDDRGEPTYQGVKLTSCHVGFSALLLPCHVTSPGGGDKAVGQIYISGFLLESDEERALRRLGRAFEQAGVEREDVEGQIEQFPVLTRDELYALRAHLELLTSVISHALSSNRASEWSAAKRSPHGLCGMIGQSESMRRLFALIERISPTNSTVLILGENGTGKELVARAIHQLSHRSEAPYLVQNCAAIPAELIESELFGHKRGAFSGAHRDRKGLFESADQGSFFLDEIGEMDVLLQAKMLRVVQEGTFLPVGESSYRKVDVRLIFATNRDLKQMVRDKRFREDLFFRINVITLHIPALRERRADIPLLVEHFIHRAARRHGLKPKHPSAACMELLTQYDWPGNVRELENEIERMMILSGEEERLEVEALSAHISGVEPEPDFGAVLDMTLPDAVEMVERQMILGSLKRHGFNKTHAAKELGISRRNLIRKVARYGFEEDR